MESVRAGLKLQKVLLKVKALDPDSASVALQYIIAPERLIIIINIPGKQPVARQFKIKADVLRRRVLATRELLRTQDSNRKWLKTNLLGLYKVLITPVESELKKANAKTLVLIPDGVLRYVPFAALYNGKRYLIQDYKLSQFNEAVKKKASVNGDINWQLVAMGFTQAVENFPALTNVKDEIYAVSHKSGLNGKMYLDNDFNKKRLVNSLSKGYTVLHLASHFEFIPGRPDASRLFLGDKSSLYLGDIARENLRFDRFDLVTFSACETGLGGGGVSDGSEMESLGALVQIQGAKSVMASLWKVEDSSTATLMERFYRFHHDKNIGKAAALRLAQLKFIKRGEGVLGHPYYWAPFVLMGDWW